MSKLTDRQRKFLEAAAVTGLYVPSTQRGAQMVPPMVKRGLVTWARSVVHITEAGRQALEAKTLPLGSTGEGGLGLSRSQPCGAGPSVLAGPQSQHSDGEA